LLEEEGERERIYKMAVAEIKLRRTETSQPWGFRLKGGVDQGLPLHVESVNQRGRSYAAGLRAGDYIVAICNSPTAPMSHMQVKQEVLRAGNELDLMIQREGGAPMPAPQAAAPVQTQEPRSQVVEEHLPRLSDGPAEIRGKTYDIVAGELGPSGQGTGAGGKPASIFDRRRQERSGYLKAKGNTIQKAFGEQ